MNNCNIIENNTQHTLIINKSKFICYIFYVDDEYRATNIIKDVKQKNKNFRHCCYVYSINNNIYRICDDKEINRPATNVISRIIKINKLTNILIIVVRYFGGIKLGASNVVKAFYNVVTECLNKYVL